jgi:hypothetical protein
MKTLHETTSNHSLQRASTVNSGDTVKGMRSTRTDADYDKVSLEAGGIKQVTSQLDYSQYAAQYGSDYYRFSADDSGMLTLHFVPDYVNIASANFLVQVLDTAGNLVRAVATGEAEAIFIPVTAGAEYFLHILRNPDLDPEIGDYTISAHVDTVDEMSEQSLQPGWATYDWLTMRDPHQWYSVELVAGTIYEFKVVASASGRGTLHDPALYLFDDIFSLLKSNDDITYREPASYRTTLDPATAFIAPKTGTYFLQVNGNGGTGFYAVSQSAPSLSSLVQTVVDGFNDRWNFPSPLGTPVNLSYAFLSYSPDFDEFTPMSAEQRQVVKDILAQFSIFSNIRFTEVSGQRSADIRFGMADLSGKGLAGLTSGLVGWQVDVLMNHKNVSPADGFREVLIHEICHALGLKHPGNYNGTSGTGNPPFATPAFDNLDFSSMSYNSGSYPPIDYDASTYKPLQGQTPKLLDIAGIQYLYGANTAGLGQTTVFTIAPSHPMLSVISSNGASVIIDAGAQTLDARIHLTAGTFSSIGIDANSAPARDNIAIAFGTQVIDAIGGAGNDLIIGNDLHNSLTGGAGNDTLDGAAGIDKALYSSARNEYAIVADGAGFTVSSKSGSDGIDRLGNIERLQFSDYSVNLNVGQLAQTISATQLDSLVELYIAYINRVPDADGMEYWIGALKRGETLAQIGEGFYNAAVQTAHLTGYSSAMTNTDFVRIVYRNVLGRDTVDSEGLNYWETELSSGRETRGSLVATILDSAHSFKNHAEFGWVADLLDNKIEVGKTFAIWKGLVFNSPDDSIANGMKIAAAVTPADTSMAITLIGVSDEFSLA